MDVLIDRFAVSIYRTVDEETYHNDDLMDAYADEVEQVVEKLWEVLDSTLPGGYTIVRS